jgi:hypothetical protein
MIDVSGGFLQIGGIRIVEDVANHALKVVAANGDAANFYATGGVSAYGFGGSGSGGGGGGGGVVDLVVNGEGNVIANIAINDAKTVITATRGSVSGGGGSGGDSYWELVDGTAENPDGPPPYMKALYSAMIDVSGGYLQIGDIQLVEDVENHAVKIIRADGSAANFYATGGVSAYGFGNDGTGGSGGGGGGLDGLQITGEGNAVTGATYDDGVLTLAKNSVFATLSQLTAHTGNTDIHVTTAQKTQWNTAYSQSHTHSNKSVLDGISSGLVSQWNTAYSQSHTHSNKSVLDGISSTLVSQWDTAYSQSHTHSNKSYLDVINQNLDTGSSPTFASYVQIGSIRLQYDSTNNAIRVVTSGGNTANFYATGGVSAYGFGSGGSGTGANNYLSSVSGSGNGTVTFARQGLTSLTWDASHSHTLVRQGAGSGNVVTDVTVAGLTVTVTKGNVSGGSGGITAITGRNSGSGNAVTSVASTSGSEVVGTLGYFYNSLSTSGTGNAVADITASNGALTKTKAYFYNALSTSGSGNVVTGISASGGTLTVTKSTITGGGAIGSVYQYVNTSLNGTLTSGVVLRTGYISLSGTIANNSSMDASIIYALTTSNMLGLTAVIQRSQWFSAPLGLAWRWNGGGVQFSVYNQTGAAVTGSTVTISWIAVCSS